MDRYRTCMVLMIIYCIKLASGEQTSLTSAPAHTSATSNAQREEIEKLKEELNVALEKHDAESVSEGVIVQPTWTQDGTTKVTDSKVTVTAQGLKEAATLRAEINIAVSKDIYVGSAENATAQKNTTVQALEKELDLQGRDKIVLDNILSSGSSNISFVNGNAELSEAEAMLLYEKNFVVYKDDEITNEKTPNVANAYDILEPDMDVRKLQNLEISKRRTKEVLLLKSVEEDLSFTLGEDVKEWTHIWHGGEEYFIGRREIDLLIVHKEDVQYKSENVVTIGQPITYLESYSYWNSQQQQQEGVILVSAQDKVLWYRSQNDSGEVEKYWEWQIGTLVSGLTYFTADSRDYLVVSLMHTSSSSVYSLNIYAFDLKSKEFWIAQRLRLQYACGGVTILDTGRDLILAVPQNDTAAIYAFNPHTVVAGHLHFNLLRTVEAEEISHISGFQMGGRSYLALGGLKPKILLYYQGDFIPKTILGSNFGNVDLFFPIPVRTYRDDLILLVQHRVDFSTHILTVLETLIWNGDSFETSIPVPCKIGVHTMYGVSCMLDVQRSEGLKGAALLRRGANIYMIVPRSKTESGLFQLKIEMLAKNSELLDLHEIHHFLENWVLEQDDLIKQSINFLAQHGSAPSSQISHDFVSLKTPELSFNGIIGEFYVHNYKWSAKDTNTDLDYIMNAIETLDYDLSPKRQRRDAVTDTKTFHSIDTANVRVEDLILDSLNAEQFFIESEVLNFDGLLNLQNLEILTQTSFYRQSTDDRLFTSSDIEFSEINGVRWAEISNTMVFRNESVAFEKLQVFGEIVAEDHLSVDTLNMLEFPDNFLWSNGPSTSTINAEKIFQSTLSANAVDTEGIINGVDPLLVITLSDSQEWNGMPTFSSLEVSELFELNGTALGLNSTLLPSNPTLLDANTVLASCNFQHLELLGFIDVDNNTEIIPLTTLLRDIVEPLKFRGDEIQIASKKRFTTVHFPLDFNVLDLKINDVKMNNFVNLHGHQELDLLLLEGYIYFYHLNITGLYDGVDITKLYENSLKINEPQLAVNTHLNFVDLLKSEQFKVHKKLNSAAVSDGYQTIYEDLHSSNIHFNDLNVKTINAPNDVYSSAHARLNNLNLKIFLENPAWTQTDDRRSVSIDHLILEDGLQADEIHGIKEEIMLKFLSKIDELPDMIFDGKVQVHHVIVTGDVQLKNLNKYDFDEDIQLTAIWLNRPNYLSTCIQFAEPVQLYNDLNILGTYQGQSFIEFIDDAIFFDHKDGIYPVMAPKSFLKNVYVLKNTKLDAVNSIPFAKIASKNTVNTFEQTLQLNRNLIIKDITIAGHFNYHPMLGLHRLIRYDNQLQSHVLMGEIPLRIRTPFEDLTVLGNANGIPNLAQFFNSLVYRAQMCSLKGNYTFVGRVNFEKNAFVKQLNGLNLIKAFENIVLINQLNPTEIKDTVIFNHVVLSQEIRVKESLTTNNLRGCNLAEILNESIRLDQSCEVLNELHFAVDSLSGNSLYARTLNDINLALVMTLHNEQHISDLVLFSELHMDGNIIANGSVNDADLKSEYANTLLISGNQHVSTPLTTPMIMVLNNLTTNGLINSERYLQQVATLGENLVLQSPLFFDHIIATQLLTNHQVSGISLIDWTSYALRLRGRSLQSISGNWSVRSLTISTRDVGTIFEINTLPFGMFRDYYRTSRAEMDESIGTLCVNVQKALSQRQKAESYINYLEHKFNVVTPKMDPQTNSRTFIIKWNKYDFLLYNIGCETLVYKWQKVHQAYNLVRSFASGRIDEKLVIIKRSNISVIEFLTNDLSPGAFNCDFKGLNRWSFDLKNVSIRHCDTFDYNITAMEASKESLDKLYVVKNNVLQRVDLNSKRVEQTWNLPSTDPNTSYNFISGLGNTMLTNSRHIILISNNTNIEIESSKQNLSYSYQLSAKYFPGSSQSELKPVSSVSRSNSSDFTQVVVHILTDLIYRLHLQVNITQLSIPESDLYDEHLTHDFMAIVQELQHQNIYPNQTFKDLDFTALKLPSNPAQVLAIRAVQIIWPVIKEIEEIQNYQKHHNDDELPISSCIITHLGVMVKEILELVNVNDAEKKDNMDDSMLHRVIKRIRKFQNQMAAYADALHAQIKQKLTPYTSPEFKSVRTRLGDTVWKTFSYSNKTKVLYINKSHLPAHGNGEIIPMEVGTMKAPQIMFAVILYEADASYESIKLFSNILHPHLYQTINAHHARSLVSIRIHSQTLFAYISDCCLVNVMIYRGVEGFKEIAHFNTSSRVKQLISTSLPTDVGDEHFFLALVLEQKIEFYEVKVDGLHEDPPFHLNC